MPSPKPSSKAAVKPRTPSAATAHTAKPRKSTLNLAMPTTAPAPANDAAAITRLAEQHGATKTLRPGQEPLWTFTAGALVQFANLLQGKPTRRPNPVGFSSSGTRGPRS